MDVITPLYQNMSEYLENKFNYSQACILERVKKLAEDMHRPTAELFGLYCGMAGLRYQTLTANI